MSHLSTVDRFTGEVDSFLKNVDFVLKRLTFAEVFANAIKYDFRSKNPTTRWSDMTVLTYKLIAVH